MERHTNPCRNSCRDGPCLSQHKACVDEGRHVFSHPDKPFDVYERALLSAWMSVLYGYYKITSTGLGSVDPVSGGSGSLAYKSLTVEPGTSIKDLQSSFTEKRTRLRYSKIGDICDEFLMISMSPPADGATVTALDAIYQLITEAKPRVLLTLQPCSEGTRVRVYAHKTKHAGISLGRLLNSLEKAVSAYLSSPSQQLSDVDIVSDYDMECLKNWVVKPTFDRPCTIHHLINRYYQQRPNATAISTTGGDVTYEELGKTSAVVALGLRASGVGYGTRVGLRMEKSVTTIIVAIGILRAGAAYVAIDPACPNERLASILQKAGVKHVVDDTGRDDLPKGVKAIQADSVQQGRVPEDWNAESEYNPTAPAYIMFTSGSTGTPKGAIHLHQSVAGSLQEVAQSFGLDEKTRFLQYATFSFDASVCEMFAPLIVGGTVCVPSPHERLTDLQSVMQQLRVTDASLTPVVVGQLDPSTLPFLKSLYIGGEAPGSEIIDAWSDRVRLCNIYGTTETGVWDTVRLGMTKDDHPRNIGRGIGAACWIVDPSNIEKPQPVGVEGELLIQGPYIGQGYLDSDGKESPFTSPPSWVRRLADNTPYRVYRTGDLAKFNEDGSILFCGRQTGFVKIRGLRIELGEVEACLNRVLQAGKSAVITTPSGDYGSNTEIVAFVEAPADAWISMPARIREELSNRLPEYMLPSIIIPLEQLPLTDSKKINRQELHRRLALLTPADLVPFRPGGITVRGLKKIDPARRLLHQLSHTIIDLFDQNDSLGLLKGHDFPLSSVGLTSIQLAYLARYIRHRWGGSITSADLQQTDTTVSDIEALVGRSCRASGPRHLRIDILKPLREAQPVLRSLVAPSKLTVFCTSITGFLGSHLLRSLVECPHVGRVVGLVRAENEAKALERVRYQAVIAKWWKDEFASKIDVWTGDLGQPKLALTPSQWCILSGNDRDITFDAVIHNGARVNWMGSFDVLEPANVQSTLEILEAISSAPKRCRLTYVSGGYLPSPNEAKEDIARKLSKASGYDQTKFLSRLILEQYNTLLDESNDPVTPRAQIIQPGFIVGSKSEGIAHPEDFLWRLAYTILNTGAVSRKLLPVYLPVAGVDQTVSLVLDSILGNSTMPVTDCRDGIHLSRFCEILSALSGVRIQTIGHDEWWATVKSDVGHGTLNHPFLPVLDWFEDNQWQFDPEECNVPVERLFRPEDVYAAVEKSVAYLVEIGYLPSTKKSSCYHHDGEVVFCRSRT